MKLILIFFIITFAIYLAMFVSLVINALSAPKEP